MSATKQTRQIGAWRYALLVIVGSMIVAACSSDDSGSDEPATALNESAVDAVDFTQGGESEFFKGTNAEEPYASVAIADDGTVLFQQAPTSAFDAKVIRDGRIDIRIDAGDFDVRGAELRSIATDLGGYIASGESYIEEYDDDRYAVGWFTLRIPSNRFDDAVSRVEGLGERVSSSLSSQDVTEEYVDLEGRLNYWEQQEAFYSKLLNEAQTIEDLVAVQTQMQDVLLNIEQIEGRLRYLDGRTSFATLTVGLTEVPDVIAPPPVEPTTEPGTIERAFEQAGEVLLATVAFLIVASAVVIPLGILALIAWLIVRLFAPRRKVVPAEE
jgi:hypothetical protein